MHELSLSDREALRAAIQIEAALDYDIQIGGKPPVKKPVDSIKLKEQLEQVKLYSLLYGELKRLLNEVDFGSGAEAAYTEGRRCIYQRMQLLKKEQSARLTSLLSESDTPASAQLQSQLRQQLDGLLNESDWQAITAAALSMMQSKLLRQVASIS